MLFSYVSLGKALYAPTYFAGSGQWGLLTTSQLFLVNNLEARQTDTLSHNNLTTNIPCHPVRCFMPDDSYSETTRPGGSGAGTSSLVFTLTISHFNPYQFPPQQNPSHRLPPHLPNMLFNLLYPPYFVKETPANENTTGIVDSINKTRRRPRRSK